MRPAARRGWNGWNRDHKITTGQPRAGIAPAGSTAKSDTVFVPVSVTVPVRVGLSGEIFARVDHEIGRLELAERHATDRTGDDVERCQRLRRHGRATGR